MGDRIQGVVSTIVFPLGQDEVAVGKAINNLLTEGWHFNQLTKTHICLRREWEVDLNEQIGIGGTNVI